MSHVFTAEAHCASSDLCVHFPRLPHIQIFVFIHHAVTVTNVYIYLYSMFKLKMGLQQADKLSPGEEINLQVDYVR